MPVRTTTPARMLPVLAALPLLLGCGPGAAAPEPPLPSAESSTSRTPAPSLGSSESPGAPDGSVDYEDAYRDLFLVAASDFTPTRPGPVRLDENHDESRTGRYLLTYDTSAYEDTPVGELACAADTEAGVALSVVAFDDLLVPIWDGAECLEDTYTLSVHADGTVTMNDKDDYTAGELALMTSASNGVREAVAQLMTN